jgi:hypothetical protein
MKDLCFKPILKLVPINLSAVHITVLDDNASQALRTGDTPVQTFQRELSIIFNVCSMDFTSNKRNGPVVL